MFSSRVRDDGRLRHGDGESRSFVVLLIDVDRAGQPIAPEAVVEADVGLRRRLPLEVGIADLRGARARR